MKLGLLADIHEHTRRLQKAIDVLCGHGAERFVVRGDVFETGKRIEPTVWLLRGVEVVGVWGSHELAGTPDGMIAWRGIGPCAWSVAIAISS